MKIVYAFLLISAFSFASQPPKEEREDDLPQIGQLSIKQLEAQAAAPCFECGCFHSIEWWNAVAKDYATQAKHAIEMNKIKMDDLMEVEKKPKKN